MVAESQAKAQVGLEVADLKDGEDTGDGDSEEAGAGGHHGSAGFTLCFGFTAFLLLRLDSFSLLHPVNVGSGITMERFKEILKMTINCSRL